MWFSVNGGRTTSRTLYSVQRFEVVPPGHAALWLRCQGQFSKAETLLGMSLLFPHFPYPRCRVLMPPPLLQNPCVPFHYSFTFSPVISYWLPTFRPEGQVLEEQKHFYKIYRAQFCLRLWPARAMVEDLHEQCPQSPHHYHYYPLKALGPTRESRCPCCD